MGWRPVSCDWRCQCEANGVAAPNFATWEQEVPIPKAFVLECTLFQKLWPGVFDVWQPLLEHG